MKRLTRLAFLLLPLAGCSSPEIVPDGIEVVILQGHSHSRYCGHYHIEASWYYVPDHKHGTGCGHELTKTGWAKTK